MKKLLSLLLLLPLGVSAQDVKPDAVASSPKVMKWEVGFNNSLAFTTEAHLGGIYDDLFLAGRNSMSIYHNLNSWQAGFIMEGGLMGTGNDWWLSPQVAVNYKVPFKKLYAYAGGAAGYVREQYTDWMYGSGMSGFVSGAQVGGVYHLGKRFGLNLEGGVRFKHMSGTFTMIHENGTGGGTFTTEERIGHTDLYFPMSVGVRYRF